MSFRIELTVTAYSDLDRHMAWIEERSSAAAADRLSERFYEALDRGSFDRCIEIIVDSDDLLPMGSRKSLLTEPNASLCMDLTTHN